MDLEIMLLADSLHADRLIFLKFVTDTSLAPGAMMTDLVAAEVDIMPLWLTEDLRMRTNF